MNDKLLLWIGGFIGVGLLYAAYKGELNPVSAVASALRTGTATPGVNQAAPISKIAADSAAGDGTTVPTGAVTSSLVQQGSVWYTADQYGNPVTPVDGVYQGLPANYIPNRTMLA